MKCQITLLCCYSLDGKMPKTLVTSIIVPDTVFNLDPLVFGDRNYELQECFQGSGDGSPQWGLQGAAPVGNKSGDFVQRS